MPRSVRTCRCVSLHTYPAYVTADSWHVVLHVCHCGREHFEEPILAPKPNQAPRTRSTRRSKRRLREGR